MPLQLAVAEPADRLAGPVPQIGDDRDLGGRGRGPIAAHGALQRSEQGAERREFGFAQRLPAKDQDAVLPVKAPQLRDGRVVQLLPQAEADDFPGQGGVELSHIEHLAASLTGKRDAYYSAARLGNGSTRCRLWVGF